MQIMKININFIAFFIIYSIIILPLYAQETDPSPVRKRIINTYNQAIQGATIRSEDDKFFTLTTGDGFFELPADSTDEFVVITAPGYQDVRLSWKSLEDQSAITLTYDPHNIGGNVNFGYKTYSKESVTGAVSSVSGDELNNAPTNVLSEALQARLPGLTVVSNIAELSFFGYSNTSKTIRGNSSVNGNSPLIIIDGVIAPTQYFEFISPKEIQSVSVLKDASSTAAYGIQGSAGVINITTKRGHNGKLNVEGYVDYSIQQMTRRPLFIDSYTYAELRNQAGERDGLSPNSQFTPAQIDLYKSGNDPGYPNNNWFDNYVKDMVNRQRIGVNASGGSDKFRYFSNLSFINQQEPLIVTDEPDRKYNPTPKVNMGNFRTNMDVKFNSYLSGYMRLTGNLKNEILAGGNMGWTIYDQIFKQPSTMYGPLSPVLADNPSLSNQVITLDGIDNSAYGMLNRSGFRSIIETNVIAQTGLKLDLDFLTKGLSASGGMAYQTYVRNETGTNQNYMRVLRGSDLSVLDKFTQYKTFENTNLAYNKSSVFFYYLNLFGSLDYSRRFGNHSIDATMHTYYLKQEKESAGSSNEVLPYLRQNFGFTALYGFKDRYFLKADLAYSGSEQFHPDNRYTFTPAISGSWLINKEDFFQADYISLLKLRTSYGINGSDQLGGARFLYLDNIRSDGSELERGNPKLEAEKIKKLNIGIDLGLFNMFTLNVDYFSNQVDNMLINSNATLPEYQGIPLNYYPKLNGGEMENKGVEVALSFNKHFTKDFSMFLGANFMHAKNKIININEASLGDNYAYPYQTQGYSLGQLWGYQVDRSNGNGMFNTEQELASSGLTYSFGSPRVGDLIYADLNSDGVIDDEDRAPLGNTLLPEQEYSISGGFNLKNWSFTFLIHGVAKSSQFLSGAGVYENQDRGIFNDIHLQSWTPERYASSQEITYPALSLSPSTNHVNSDFFLSNRSYIRLRNVGLSYEFSDKISQKIKSDKIKVTLNIQNLFTFDKMKSDYIDPEIGTLTSFQPFRVYNLGVSASF